MPILVLTLFQSLLDLNQSPLLLGRELDHGLRERVYRLIQREG